jgi:hypothetical protein
VCVRDRVFVLYVLQSSMHFPDGYSLHLRYRVHTQTKHYYHCIIRGSDPLPLRLNPRMGPSTRVRICVRIAIRFRARFERNHNGDPILLLSPITMVSSYISAEKKLTCWTPLAANRTPIRTGICMEYRPCRQPLCITCSTELYSSSSFFFFLHSSI